jgi:lipopolysaccharide transport system permease protein
MPRWVRRILTNYDLVFQLGQREVTQRFRGSRLGPFWMVLQSLATVAIFYFVFVVVFKARWRSDDELPSQFVLSLFAGLIVYQLFSEVVGRAPTLISSNVNFVKKVVFPLDMLTIISLFPAVLTATITAVVWIALFVGVRGELPPASSMLVPAVLGVVLLYAIALSWLLSALCVYFRDLSQAVPIVLQVMIYASPVLYPLDRVPEGVLQNALYLNPLTIPIEAVRALALDGPMPSNSALLLTTLIAIALTLMCHAFFMTARKAFADVL